MAASLAIISYARPYFVLLKVCASAALREGDISSLCEDFDRGGAYLHLGALFRNDFFSAMSCPCNTSDSFGKVS